MRLDVHEMSASFLLGTNLQALIDFSRDPMNFSAAEIVLVISNKADVHGLYRAEKAGIATKVMEAELFFYYKTKALKARHINLSDCSLTTICDLETKLLIAYMLIG